MNTNNFQINEYLELNGKLSFEEFRFNEVDFAILGCLIYADFVSLECFNKSLENDEDILIRDYNDKAIMNKLSKRYLNGKGCFEEFFQLVANSERFKDLKMTNVVNKLNDKEQFFACTWEIDNKKIVVFRGTDNTITGWKEDILTMTLDEVYAQGSALKYLKNATKNILDKVYVVGHSKGGNLAYYAFFNLPENRKNKVIKVYNLDGNGFKNDDFDYVKYQDKIEKIVPSDDVVGIIYDDCSRNTIVKSKMFGVIAHDLLTWKIDPEKPNRFKREAELTDISEAFMRSTNKWFRSLSDDDIKDFIDFIFKLAELNEPNTLTEFLASVVRNAKEYLKLIVSYPQDKKKKIRKLSIDAIADFKDALFEVKKRKETYK